jgi:glycosylphosphatidylinositol transamidase (GPIT) subunit GPI8
MGVNCIQYVSIPRNGLLGPRFRSRAFIHQFFNAIRSRLDPFNSVRRLGAPDDRHLLESVERLACLLCVKLFPTPVLTQLAHRLHQIMGKSKIG